MPGYVIHIAIAQEYLKKHLKKEEKEEFINGVIAPDLTKIKSETHYGKSPAYTNLLEFLKNKKIDNSFNKGYFLHLVTDYLFYNYYLTSFSKPEIYDDYDMTNEFLISKYDVTLPKKIENQVFFKKGCPKFLNLNLACKLIDEISNYDLEDVEKEVLANDIKWFNYKNII
mgnify:FL=1